MISLSEIRKRLKDAECSLLGLPFLFVFFLPLYLFFLPLHLMFCWRWLPFWQFVAEDTNIFAFFLTLFGWIFGVFFALVCI